MVKLSSHHCKDAVLSPQTRGNTESLLVTNQQCCNYCSLNWMFRSPLGSSTEREFQTSSGKVLFPLNFISDTSTQKFVLDTKPSSIFQPEAPPCSLKHPLTYLGENFPIIGQVKVTVTFSSKESWIVPLSYQFRTQGESFLTLKDFTRINNWGQNLTSINCLRGLKPSGCTFSHRSNHFVKPNTPTTSFHFSHH